MDGPVEEAVMQWMRGDGRCCEPVRGCSPPSTSARNRPCAAKEDEVWLERGWWLGGGLRVLRRGVTGRQLSFAIGKLALRRLAGRSSGSVGVGSAYYLSY